MNKSLVRALALAVLTVSPAFAAADDDSTGWLPWLVVGAVALFVCGVVIRMVLAARFPAGYKAWARRNRDEFAGRNEAWDRDDDAFHK